MFAVQAFGIMKSFWFSCCLTFAIGCSIFTLIMISSFFYSTPAQEPLLDIKLYYPIVNSSRVCYDKLFLFQLQMRQFEMARLELKEVHILTTLNDSFAWLPKYHPTNNMNFYNQNYGIFGFEGIGKSKKSGLMKRKLLYYYRIWKGGSVHILSLLYKYSLTKKAPYFPCLWVGENIQRRLLNITHSNFSRVFVKCMEDHPVRQKSVRQKINYSSRDHFSFTFVRNPLSRFISAYTEIEDQIFSNTYLSTRFLTSPVGSEQRFLEFVRLVIASNGSDILFTNPYNTQMLHIAPQIGTLHYALEMEGGHINLFHLGDNFNSNWAQMADASGFPGLADLSDMKQAFPHSSSEDKYGTTLAARGALAAAVALDKSNIGTDVGFRTGDQSCSNRSDSIIGDSVICNDSIALRGTTSYHYLRAICRVYLSDYICTGFPLPLACADLIDEADELAREFAGAAATSDQHVHKNDLG